jgi:hypothetical protein
MEKKIIEARKSGLLKKAMLGNHVTINDLRDKEFNGEKLTSEEVKAIRNFEVYRLEVLNNQVDEDDFHKKYQQLQVLANLGDYKEFLKDKFNKS